VDPASIVLQPVSGYSVTFVWWMPKAAAQDVPFDVSFAAALTRVDVTARAVYLDKSYSGASPRSEPPARFLQTTAVVYTSTLR